MHRGDPRGPYSRLFLLGYAGLMSSAACSAPGGPGSAQSWTDGGAIGTVTTQAQLKCTPARASEDLGPRIDVLNLVGTAFTTPTGPRAIQVSELFDRFNTLCGRCHVSTANGNRQVSAATFATNFDATWLASIKTDDPAKAMPPEAKGYSTRPDNDPVHQLVALLEPWLEQGRPSDVFFVDDSSASGLTGGVVDYTYAELTNLGDCIPPATAYAQSPSAEMESKDEMFASLDSSDSTLPATLAETDLTTFDAEVLAANGVIAYVPTYPLWSDGSGKLRHVRVPKGTTVTFDKEKQTFNIPPNTRFYKTFFRKIIDGAGRESNRKIETRLIVARPDTLEADGITPHPNAIFGTYKWSEDELTATLHTLPYRDGTPFADQTLEYVTDEVEYHEVLESLGPGAGTPLSSQRFKDELTKHPGLVQHYAIPGSIRCVQCHRGSSTHDFVLGFFPLQIAQRPATAGGTYEPTGTDEVNQLQRLIDYGVISGMTSPADVVPLEKSQAPRNPRTPQELTAQAYMVGNCMHCHNPRGYPSLVKPELAAALNFMPGPGADGGGIFDFSLESMSPIRSRGAGQSVPIPYITPSLRDYPVSNLDGYRVDNGAFLGLGGEPPPPGQIGEVTWTPKYSVSLENAQPTKGCGPHPTKDDLAYCGSRTSGRSFVAAPWRSLIYRNVDAPFPYFDDYVPFPHMPMNSAGFDCRAPRIMGEWMVSLPAVQKNPLISEDALPTLDGKTLVDDAPQPYIEVKPDDPRYPSAQKAAQDRLDAYKAGVRYNYCETVLSPDILDPVSTLAAYHPDPTRYLSGGIPPDDPTRPGLYAQPALGIPYHSHWFDYDPTDSPPPWLPRRADAWYGPLVDHQPDQTPPAGQKDLTQPSEEFPLIENDVDDRRRVTEALGQSRLTEELTIYATTELPYGLWQGKPGCETKLAAQPKVGDFGDQAGSRGPRPAWMSGNAQPPDQPINQPLLAGSPVFMMSPGGALYHHICFNCHGPKADGKGLQGDALAAASEGQARPANFVAGLFGPIENPGQNLIDVFSKGAAEALTTPTDLGSRYMAWMALGGTLQLIPKDVIHQVEATRILGQTRPNVASALRGTTTVSANMLNLAKGLCAIALPDPTSYGLKAEPFTFGGARTPDAGYPLVTSKQAPFVTSNGDWELWMNICNRFSPPVLRVYGLTGNQSTGSSEQYDVELQALYYADGESPSQKYPANAPVLDHNRGLQMGVHPDKNYFAACLAAPVNPTDEQNATVARFQALTNNMPFCDDLFLKQGRVMWSNESGTDADELDNIKEWSLRGAIAAGMSVFSYLRSADLAHQNPKPYYNECQLLP